MWGFTHKDLPTLPFCMEKVAILGRIFDPVHWGHLSIAQTAATQFALDRVIWAVDRATPHKSHSVLASFEQVAGNGGSGDGRATGFWTFTPRYQSLC
jgi:cytidyltransferase-like protein